MLERWTELSSRFPWAEYTLEILALLLGAWVVRGFVMVWLRRWAGRSATPLDDALVALFDRALTPVVLLAVLAAALNLLPLSVRLLAVLNRVLYLGVLTVGLYFSTKALQLVLNHWLMKTEGRESLREPVRFLVRVIFAALGITILLDNLGVSLTAVWTTLGVGSVAIALALQDTLSNFFAGVHIRVDNPVRLGDYVRLDTGDEGFVVQIGWRSTQIRTLPNNVVVVPNAKLASAILTNFSLPESQMSVLIPVGVSYRAEPAEVERILVEEATEAAGQVPGLRAEPAPFVRFIPGFGDSSLNFTLICRVNEFVDQYLVQHELRKRIFARFRREGIEIPFPQRDVHLYSERQGAQAQTSGAQ
ncbi:MAG: mechanosensitive ion channel family protein [Acidobacteria bacterium]|nr:mechanosensitive ion channel family protein [Acidobacteriota bacterium]